MAWTTADDVLQAWIGDDKPDDASLVTTWIDKAERVIRFRISGLQSRIDLGEPDLQETVVDIVTAMVARVFRNPEGIRQVSEGTGPFTESRTYGGDNPGTLDLLASELERLSEGRAGAGGAFTIDMIPSTSVFSGYRSWWPIDVG